MQHFNPRSYKRSDHEFRSNNLQAETISIHAPTRGATVSGSMVYPVLSNFNPRSYKRSDALAPFLLYPAFIFQSTLLQEERRGSGSGIIYPPFISIHAPTRGATGMQIYILQYDKISIHAPTRGATYSPGGRSGRGRFQSTLLQEERQQKCTIFLMHLCNNYCIVSI